MRLWYNYSMKRILDYEGLYSITDEGKVYSHISQKYLAPRRSKNGYVSVSLQKKGMKPRSFSIHRLVLSHFGEQVNDKLCVNHKDGNKLNNHISNLEWCTYSENILHADKNGLRKVKRGETHSWSILSDHDVSKIRELYEKGLSQYKIARQYSISQGNVSLIVNYINRK